MIIKKKQRITFVTLILLILFLTLVHYNSVYNKNHLSLNEFLQNPAQFPEHQDSILGPYGGSFEGGFYIIYNKQRLRVLYNQTYTPPKYGEVLVYGIIKKDRSIQAIAVHNYNYNYLLYTISGITGIIIFLIFLKQWKLTLRGFKDA